MPGKVFLFLIFNVNIVLQLWQEVEKNMNQINVAEYLSFGMYFSVSFQTWLQSKYAPFQVILISFLSILYFQSRISEKKKNISFSLSLCFHCSVKMSFLLPWKKNIPFFFHRFWFAVKFWFTKLSYYWWEKPFVVIFSLFWGNVLHCVCGHVIVAFHPLLCVLYFPFEDIRSDHEVFVFLRFIS